MRKILKQNFKKINFVQQIVIFDYLKTLKNIQRFELNEIFCYIQKYSIVSTLLLKKKLQTKFQNK